MFVDFASKCTKKILKILMRCEAYLAHSGDVGIVPGIIIHDNCPIGHSGYLIAIVPPGHHLDTQ